MAKRYTIRKQYTIDMEGKDAHDIVVEAHIDLAKELSQRLQSNVRQGRVFNLHKAQVALQPTLSSGDDLDVGLATQGTLRWCPATKNSAKAWRHLFGVWKKQKQLRVGAMGGLTRYDDFELAYSSTYINSRTSTVYATGMGDNTTESAVIYGASTDSSDITLEDIYESLQPQSSPSRFPIDNSVVKESKFTAEFPPERVINLGASYSAVSHTDLGQGDSGAQVQSQPEYITDGACLAGVLVFKAQCLAEDVALNTGDVLYLNLDITFSLGIPLARTPRSRSYQRAKYQQRISARYRGKAKRRAWKTYRKRSK